jgi:hypothetical protein
MVIMPYYRPIAAFSRSDQTGRLGVVWGKVGGYTTASLLLLLAFIGVCGRSQRPLRLGIGVWSLLVILRTFMFGDPPVTRLFHLVPDSRQTAFYRYSQPTWELAIVVLAAFGLNDLLSGAAGRRRLLSATGLTLTGVSMVRDLTLFGRRSLHSAR